ncbi:MAG TPA: flagellar basal body L-ring protein FlgH, partial [Rhizomicrobium sp.]|nr:flagellar basal body L-ring protein FlgH [Rhizomicrobium sp.]
MRNVLLKLSAALMMGAALSACSAVDRLQNIGQAPKLSAVGNPAGRQIVAEIPRPSPITHIDNSLWQPGAQSFFHDPRAMHIGDVITVNVSVADTAKLQNTTSRSRTNSENASLDNLLGLEKVLPGIGMDPSSLVKTGSDNSNVGVGSIQRAESISMTLAALVAQVLPNGNLVIDGHQQVRV